MWIGEWLHCLCSLEVAFQIGSVTLAVYLISKFSAVFLHFVGFKKDLGTVWLDELLPTQAFGSCKWTLEGVRFAHKGDR